MCAPSVEGGAWRVVWVRGYVAASWCCPTACWGKRVKERTALMVAACALLRKHAPSDHALQQIRIALIKRRHIVHKAGGKGCASSRRGAEGFSFPSAGRRRASAAG